MSAIIFSIPSDRRGYPAFLAIVLSLGCIALSGSANAAQLSIIVPERGQAVDVASQALTRAHHDAARQSLALPWHKRPSDLEEALPWPDDNQFDGSLSRGTIRDGQLRDAAYLPHETEALEVIERHRRRHTHFGTDELVNALTHAAQSVQSHHGGAPLRVGNLGFRHGGPIPWSVSHEAGRDADLAFYAIDADGRSVPTPDLITFDANGRAVDEDLYFDTPRNWHLVRTLLTDPSIKVQWLFLSEPLKAMLIDHAIDIGEPDALITRAAHTLHQPTDALPHDDHLHLRLGCSTEDRLRGCIDWGPTWDWYDWSRPALFAQAASALNAVQNSSGGQGVTNDLQKLTDHHSPYAPAVALSTLLNIEEVDDDHLDSLDAALTVVAIDDLATLRLLGRAIDKASEAGATSVLEPLYTALGRANHSDVAHLAINRALDERRSTDERRRAIHALKRQTTTDLIPSLLAIMGDDIDASLRIKAAEQLHRITARHDGLSWDVGDLREPHLRALDHWTGWFHDEQPSSHTIQRHLVASHGIEQWPDVSSIPTLIDALVTAPEYQRYHLNRILADWTDRWAPHYWDSPASAASFWRRWWQRNEDRLTDDRPRPWLPYLDD